VRSRGGRQVAGSQPDVVSKAITRFSVSFLVGVPLSWMKHAVSRAVMVRRRMDPRRL